MNVEEALEIIENVLDQGRLNRVQETVFRQCWEGLSYSEIACRSGYEVGYIRDVGFKLWQSLSHVFNKKVTKNNFHGVLKQQYLAMHGMRSRSVYTEEGRIQASVPNLLTAKAITAERRQDWAEAVDVSMFYGYPAELDTLKQWIVHDHCRLITLLGMGGIGKTALAAKLAEQIQDEFQYLIWRSLRNAPPVKELAAELLQFFSNGQPTDLPETLDGRISKLMECLRSSRCLLILDNAESILRSGDRTGCYQEGYEGYGQLLRCIAETTHTSCLVLTSREKPRGLAAKEGETLPVRSLHLTGLQTLAGQEIFKARGDFWASESDWKDLIQHYAGNPLALKMIAPVIQNFYNDNVANFLVCLKQSTLVFDDIANLLERQFNRLSALEKEVMYWLAINREPITFIELQADFAIKVSESEILETLASLQRRSLIEKSANHFTQQPLVMDYVTNHLVERVCAEIVAREIALFNSHALIKGTAKDCIRHNQIRFILQPVIDKLVDVFSHRNVVEEQLNKTLSILQAHSQLKPGYAGGNILNILEQLQTDLNSYDSSGITIRQAELQQIKLPLINIHNTDIAKFISGEDFNEI